MKHVGLIMSRQFFCLVIESKLIVIVFSFSVILTLGPLWLGIILFVSYDWV